MASTTERQERAARVRGDADDPLVRDIVEHFRRGEPVHAELPSGGAVGIDRKLPYLLVHRLRRDGGRRRREDRPGGAAAHAGVVGTHGATASLIEAESSYLLLAPSELELGRRIVRALAEAGTAEFGAFLVLELWGEREHERSFRILAPCGKATAEVDALATGLGGVEPGAEPIDVVVEECRDNRHPPGTEPLLPIKEAVELGTLLLGLEVPTVYLRPEQGGLYPVYFRTFRERFSRALRRALFEFIRIQTDAGIANFHVLGRRSVDDAVWEADRRLSEIGFSFQFLLLVTPVNVSEAWEEFCASGYERVPEFSYRLLPVDPELLKRRLYAVELDRIDDPALAYLLRDKRDELDKQISMLQERGSTDFLYSGLRLYGVLTDGLLDRAESLLESVSYTENGRSRRLVRAEEFRLRALEEIDGYRRVLPDLDREVRINPRLNGLMVSDGNLLIPDNLELPPGRVEALIQHEVGTHVLTWLNGRSQPLRQLCHGLAAYDELQEGLAVLAEYLVGGLSAARMRVLAARVVAAHAMQQGSDLVETWRLLHHGHGFTAHTAFQIAARVHEGGGFSRDMIYLRGLANLLEHLREGGELEPLYIGKVALKHLDVLTELRERGILHEPPLLPPFLEREEPRERLAAARAGIRFTDMVSEEAA